MKQIGQNGAGYNIGSNTCGSIASGNSIVFDSSTDRYLISQPINTTNAVGLQFAFGNSGCGTDSSLYPVYLEYSIGDTSYLLTVLSTTSSPDLYTVQLPSLAQAEDVQFSWTQTSGFQANEAVWQLDNVAILFANQVDSALLDTFTRPALSSSVLFFSSGTIEDSVCGIDEEGLVFTGSSGSPSEYVLTPPFSFGSNSQSEVCSAPCLCGPGGYSDDFDSASYSYLLWEKVIGGQVQGSLCSTAANPILLFNTDVTTELVTVPLNLTDVRVMSFDLQIAGTLFNGTCIPLNTGNVVLTYRIGTNRQWEVIGEYSSVGKLEGRDYFNADQVNIMFPDCMQTCGTQLRWQFSSVQPNALWSIDNIAIGSSSNSAPVNRREVDNTEESNFSMQKRQTIAACNLYYDNFDAGSYDTALWSSVTGASASLTPCRAPTDSHYWLYFFGFSTRWAITQSLDLTGIEALTFNLLFGSSSNGCNQPSNSEGVSVQYRIGSSGSWVTMENYDPSDCCTTAPYQRTIYLPVAIQRNDVYFRWYQQSHTTSTSSDVWAIDEVRIGEVTVNLLYQDTFSTATINTNIWLSVIGGTVTTPSCGSTHSGGSLYFASDFSRQAVTKFLDFRQAESISFYLRIGSTSGDCEIAEIGENVELSWRVGNGSWSILDTFTYSSYQNSKYIFVGLHDNVRTDNVQLRISQAVLTTSQYDTWSIDNFEVHSYTESLSNTVCSIPPDPTPSPTTPSTPSACNYYYDLFDSGTYNTDIWTTVTGVMVSSAPCGLPSTRHSAMDFYSLGTRELITQLLDLRGVNFISFYLRSGSSSNGCSTPSSFEGIYVAYRIGSSSTFNNLEYYAPSCCSSGRTFVIYLPKAVQVNSVQLRWSQPSHSTSTNSDRWVLDDVNFGEGADAVLYEDTFTTSLNPTLWSSIVGGTVTTPPCGSIDVGTCLYFSQDGTREAVTQFLDLRQVSGVSFYLMTTSDGNCEGLNSGETVELSIRAGYGSWNRLESLSNADSKYYYVEIPANFKVHSAQLQLMQNIQAINGYDVWAIDSFQVHSKNQRTICSTACISDNFDSGSYSTTVWSTVSGAQVLSPPCSTKASSMALYFSESGTREAITQALDLRGLYAISFILQIVSYNERCVEITSGNDIRVYYSTTGNSGSWNEIGTYSGSMYAVESTATVPLPLEARSQPVYIRIAQPSYSGTVWSMDDFSIYSPNQCPPLSITETVSIIPPTPTPTPSTSLTCNFYSDNFDSNSFSSTMWSSTIGLRLSRSRCGLPSLQRYGAEFYSFGTRELVTTLLDLRGVESFSFYLISGSSSNGCTQPSSFEGIYVAYRYSSSSSWVTMEYFEPSCCSSGRPITVYVPSAVQGSSVSLRWSQPSHSTCTSCDPWVLDNVVIGNYVETTLYGDDFSSGFDSSLWALVRGGSATTPPCGTVYSGGALYFSQAGTREAITQTLDLRDATGLSFYIQIGSSDDTCNGAERGEDIELSYRVNYDDWTTLQTFVATSFRDALYIYATVEQTLQVNGVQFRLRQNVLAYSGYDVWSIDNFAVVSREKITKCSMACSSDNFNSGSWNAALWRAVNGGFVSIPPCSDMHTGRSLYFTGSGAREAVTNELDLRGIYAVSFTLQIGSYDGECDQAETGDDVVFYYSLSGPWVQLQTFSATSYTRATTVTVPIPRTVRTQGVSLRWAQTQHSGSSQDTWFIDNVGVYSPDQCPPVAYQTTTPSPVVPSPITSASLTCNYYYDNFDAGTHKTSVWSTVTGVRVSSSPCGLPSTQHYAMEFYSFRTREIITQLLDLRGVEFISFYLRSGSSSNGCSTPSSFEGIYVAYSIGSSSTFYNLEYYAPSCCTSGNTFTVYLPSEVQANSVRLRWSQPSHTTSSSSDLWVLDNVEIGRVLDTTLYQDLFTTNINADIWSSITGGSVTTPPCGVTDVGTTLYFAGHGVREAVTVSLDLRQATSVSFYLRIGSSDGRCENADTAENIEFSYKLGANGWSLLQTFTSTSYRTAAYVNIDIQNNMRFNGVQLRISQAVLTTGSYDVWSIDSFTVHSRAQRPECTMACYFDNFYGNYSTSLWSTVTGGALAPLTCNTNYQYSDGLYFDGSGTRSATTNNLDLSGLYAISFRLQIVSNTDECGTAPSGQDVTLQYSINNGAWSEFERFNSADYDLLTSVSVQLPVNARRSNVTIQIMQSNHLSSVWAIDNFGIYSPDTCPPTNYETVTVSMSPTPLPYPSPTISTVCNYYSDNFDTGSYKTSLWNTVTGVRVSLQPCSLSYLQHYGMEFYSSSTRDLITDPLDLRGVEYISFYLLSGTSSNGCSQPSSFEGIFVSYRIGSSSYNNLEYYAPSCCTTGAYFKIYLPSVAQTTSVSLRWYQPSHTTSEFSDRWVLDDVEIGFNVDNHFYEDYFSNAISNTVFLSLVGGSVTTPPCGATHSGTALYFSSSGTREVITQSLDLRQATGLSFYLRIGSSDGTCENNDGTEAIVLSWRVNYGTWTQLGSHGNYRDTRYVYVSFSDSMQVTGVQFRIEQNTLSSSNEDVWSIDDFIVHSMFADTLCTLACYSDDFNNGQYSSALWTTVDGATVTIPPCSNQYLGNALYFDGSGTRQAVTRPVDIRGVYAISFYLHIGSFSGSCEIAESGENVNLHYQLSGSSSWVLLRSYDATAYTRETKITEALPREVQQAGVTFRWLQVSHSGALDDTWSIDNVGFHSPDECPPTGYEPLMTLSSATTMTLTTSSTSFPSPTPTMLSACNYYYDNFDSGTWDNDIWQTVLGVRVARSVCGLPPTHFFGMQFYSSSTRQMETRALDLRGVEVITFYMISGTSSNACSTPSSFEGIYVAYRLSSSSAYSNLEYLEPSCCTSGTDITLYLPTAAQVNGVYLRWYQPSHTTFVYSDVWVLDNVQIGESIDVILYQDLFSSALNSLLWSSVIGGTVTSPPCGATYSGNALYFTDSGIREAVTQFLDLRQAKTVTFYLEIGSSDGRCEESDATEAVELSFRAGYSSWTRLQSFSATYVDGRYVSVEITSSMRVHAGQFRLMQNIVAESNYDVWSVDNFEIHSIYSRTICSMPCISDGFYGTYDTQVWSRVDGARVTRPPCSSAPSNGLLYFDQSGTRQAITNNLDLRGMYAISFTLQILVYNGLCSAVQSGENVRVSYSADSGNSWNELESFDGSDFITETRVTVPLPRLARSQSISIRIAQPSYSSSVWSIENFEIYSPDVCPPMGITETATIIPPTPTPTTIPSVCNSYSDNFDAGAYQSSIWASVIGVQVASQPCDLSPLQHFALRFYFSSTRQVITNPLDLRGVEYISFYLISGTSSNGCSQPSRSEGIYVAYRIGSSSYVNIEYYEPSCCTSGRSIRMYLPQVAQTTSVTLRWSQLHTSSTNVDVWVLDDVKIGEDVETILYDDKFTNAYDVSVWSTVQGGTVTTPPCGQTHSGNALYFSQGGTRQAVTQALDLRDATGMSFYLRIGSSDNRCEQAENGEGIVLSYRIGATGVWTSLQTYTPSGFVNAEYVYVSLGSSFQYSNVQFRFMQTVLTTASYDVWSIDNFEIISSEPQTKCSMSCYSDNFNSGVFDATLWSSTMDLCTLLEVEHEKQ
ncbi:reelin-like [Dysidea avara]|uniref:reelin-like n=1 Tax=Dysidea avara TaxID=196820 RepID=UPI00332E2E2F